MDPVFETIQLERSDKVLTLRFNRPNKLNAVNSVMHHEILEAFEFGRRDKESNVIVLTGNGRGFCAGGDVGGMAASETGTNVEKDPWDVHSEGRLIIESLVWIEKPTVAMVNGPAAGLGATLALYCDIVVMGKSATIGDRHVNVGLVAGDGGAVVWPMLVGIHKAKEFLFTGKMLSAMEAEAFGLVNRVVDDDELVSTVNTLCLELSKLPQFALRATKVAINRQLRARTEEVLDLSLALESLSVATEEHRVAASQFVNRNRKGTA